MATQDSFLANFSKEMATMLPLIGCDEFTIKLAEMFKKLTPANNIMMIHFPRKKLPMIAYNDLPPENRTSLVNRYVRGAFLLDPFYLAARKQRLDGFYPLNEVMPDRFEQSEYNSTYFKHSGLTDECSYLIQFGDDGEKFVIVSLGIIDEKEQYDKEDLANLAAIAPLVDSLVTQHWVNGDAEDFQLDMRVQLETALEEFGSSILTDRENQTVQMILHGHSNRGIAERLDISIETVKLHRKNAYHKLDLGSQGELFNLFINSLMNIENYTGGDPLVPYLERTKPGTV